jgi:hypothetical protein
MTLQNREVTYKPLAEEPLLSTVYNVEVCAVGIEYPLSSGPTTFTQEDLLQAVASQQDPAVVSPRVWLGHPEDDRFHKGRATLAGSAEPALGKVINLRVEDSGMTLVGDISGCPTWLAKILASAYPSRSIEGFQEAVTASGRTWGLVITDLALLGVTWPGVSTLEDLQDLYSEDGPDGVEVKEDAMTVAAGRAVKGQVDLDDIRRAFGKAVEAGVFGELQWPWIRAVLLDPNELIIDDDATGEIFRVSYTPDEQEGATFGELKQVKVQYVNASQKKDSDARLLATRVYIDGRQVAATYTSRDDSRVPNDQEVTMDPAKLRASIGLPADATDDQVSARLRELDPKAEENPSPDQVPASPEEPFKGPGSPPNPAPPQEAPTKADPEPRPVGDPERVTSPPEDQLAIAASVLQKAGMTAVPTSAWQGMQASVAQLSQKHEQDVEKADGELLASAVRKGKVFPAQREFYASKLKDPQTRESFRHLLTASVERGGLQEGLVPIEARQLSVDAGDSATAEAYPTSWLPEVQGEPVAAGSSPTPPITLEG